MKKYLVAAIATLIFLHHIICTILYNVPANPLTGTYNGHVSNYMDPLFTQKWLLFAPEPATFDLKLWYKVKNEHSWSSWFDPLEPVLKKHHHMRFTYNAKLLYVYGNIARDLSIANEALTLQFPCGENDTACKKRRNDSLEMTPEFILAKRYVKRDILSSFATTKIDSIQIMIIQLYPKQFSERLSNKPFGYANAIEFNAIAFKDDN